MKGKQRRVLRGEHIERSGYTTNKTISVSKLPKGPGPGAKHPKNSKKK